MTGNDDGVPLDPALALISDVDPSGVTFPSHNEANFGIAYDGGPIDTGSQIEICGQVARITGSGEVLLGAPMCNIFRP